MSSSSSSVGIWISIFLDGSDIVFDLTAISSTQADDSSDITSIYEGDKKEPVSYWSQRDSPDLSAPSARKVDASPFGQPGGLMEQSNASLQRGRQS